MRRHRRTWFFAVVLLANAGCRPAAPAVITVVDGEVVQMLETAERVPLLFLTEAGISVSPQDRLLVNGLSVPIDQPLDTHAPLTVQLRRAVDVQISTPDGDRSLRSAAMTVAGALSEAGIDLRAGDLVLPPAGTVIDGPLTITYQPARELTVTIGERVLSIWSSAGTISDALARGRLGLTGLDYSVPDEAGPLPEDGQIRIVHVHEELLLGFEPIPFESEYRDSAEVELGQEVIVQPGQAGLAMTRTRIRYEDGREVARVEEQESIVQPPTTRIAERGTKIVLKTANVDGTTVTFWRAIEMYATSYSPCRSGVEGQCFTGTSLGVPVRKGVVAVDISFYNQMAGQQVYVAGYGPAVIADVGAGRIVEANLGIPRTRWIDLGYSDSDWQEWGRYVTVYFLPPAPTVLPSVLQ